MYVATPLKLSGVSAIMKTGSACRTEWCAHPQEGGSFKKLETHQAPAQRTVQKWFVLSFENQRWSKGGMPY